MSGYTPDALSDIKDGGRLEVVLLDKSHVEAMLTGFSPPVDLLNLMLDHPPISMETQRHRWRLY